MNRRGLVKTIIAGTSGILMGKAYGAENVRSIVSNNVENELSSSNSLSLLSSKLSEFDGAKYIGRCPDINNLRKITPQFSGQKIDVVSFYSTDILKSSGGGEFYAAQSKDLKEKSGIVIRVDEDWCWIRVDSVSTNIWPLEWLGIRTGSVQYGEQNANILQESLVNNYRVELIFPSAMTYLKPGVIKIPGNWAGVLRGSNTRNCIIRPSEDPKDPNTILIEYNAEKQFSWGLRIENLSFDGMNFTLSALRLTNVAYVYTNNLQIYSFHGCNLWLDKVQDSVFEATNIQDGGYSNGDPSDNTKTTHPALLLTSTIKNDACNMLRFNNCQIENNKCSPYVRIDNGIGLMFNQIHAEVRDENRWGKMDFMEIDSADVQISEHAGSRFRNAIIIKGYGITRATGGRSLGGDITTVAIGKRGTLALSNCSVSNIEISAYSGNHQFSNVSAKNVTLKKTAGSIRWFGGSIESLSVNGTVNPALGVHFDGVLVFKDVIYSDSQNDNKVSHSFINSTVLGNMEFNCTNGVYYANNVAGSETVTMEQRISSPSNVRVMHGITTPTAGNFSQGDRVINTNPIAGGWDGWRCIEAGNPGVWKGYGKISD
ncbi:DUF4097 family beta strand repeat-containing protein [Serratia proteamaculans]|jgi:hypothetical protein|uniref:hypothetical protein n=1 Tax=Serratia proteamaculans TaxID=28151 RepID=UPI00217C8406|nr:hypothetical protein [Serratia proteamaculans]CAI0896357.1 Uncharacterised protein [Serratia proteamaculans]CAI0957193.1 Uncharacterised protein [Serratia proteamaculans]CAI1873537.1 Uncharacterised protein [Serratia proteamaculans]